MFGWSICKLFMIKGFRMTQNNDWLVAVLKDVSCVVAKHELTETAKHLAQTLRVLEAELQCANSSPVAPNQRQLSTSLH